MQRSIEISSHNVANAATPGYSRQRPILASTEPVSVSGSLYDTSAGQVGIGVTVQNVQRFRSAFLERQIRRETSTRQAWDVRREVLREVEVALDEPSERGINNSLGMFWEAWHNLASTPESMAARANTVGMAVTLSARFREAHRQLSALRDDLDARVEMQVGQINNIARRVARLNGKIRNVQGKSLQPNDLYDKRDTLLKELAGLVNLDTYETETGAVSISLGGKQLVMDETISELAVEEDPTNGMQNRIVWKDTGDTVRVRDVALEGGLTPGASERLVGELGGTLIARDLILPEKIAQLDELASTLIEAVNEVHRNGYGLPGSDAAGNDFFTGTGARDIDVTDYIKEDHSRVATAAAPDSPGDSSIALEIAQLRRATLLNGDTTTIGDYYRAAVAGLGQEAQQAEVMSENHTTLQDHLENRQEEVSGVSLDEEMVHLIQYQRTYQAAARLVTVADEMLNRIINGMGRVGR